MSDNQPTSLDEILAANRRYVTHQESHIDECDCYRLSDFETKQAINRLLIQERITELKHLEGGTDYWLASGEVITVSDRIAELQSSLTEEGH